MGTIAFSRELLRLLDEAGANVYWTPAFMRRDATESTVGSNFVITAVGVEDAIRAAICGFRNRFGAQARAALDGPFDVPAAPA
jgi:hypothetical protein